MDNERDNIINFTKGVLDRIRDHIKENFPKGSSGVTEIKEEITGRKGKVGGRIIWTREIDEGD